MKNKKYHTINTMIKRNTKIPHFGNSSTIQWKSGNIDIPNIQIHDSPPSWLGTGMSIKSGGAKLVLW